MRNFYLLVISFLLISWGNQTVIGQTNKTALNQFAVEKAAEFQQKKAEAIDYAKLNDIPLFIETDNSIMELMSIDRNGQPQYYITNNSNASATSSTNNVNPGGSAGLSLDGSGMIVHEWDAGAVRASHQEFGGRVTQGDGVTTTNYHSTHVGGTLIASGVQSSAKGMAPAANLSAYDWNSDESEMATAGANGALVSNHSYGYGNGWVWNGSSWTWYGNTSISTQEDDRFGFYDSQAQQWDEIAKNAPYYLIVKSAGNDRGDGPTNGDYPQDGPYDCIGNAGNAKNLLTVGAVEDIPGGYSQPSDVVMSSFSSWGPADDGRIKPDISTNGVSLYSTDDDNDADYTSLSGTSMAAPVATGSLILLQEHYQDLNGSGNLMRAATLKALVIHTADEAGPNPGPDYMFGWGLMNTETAAAKITENQTLNLIEELSLNNGGSYSRTVTASGSEPLVVTVVWTDIEGTPVAASLDPSDPMVVNELDLRITEGANTYYPWSCNRINHSAAATRNSENNVDNVEMVTIDNPIAGIDYTITVDHDGTLSGGSQNFSIIISGIGGTSTPQPPVANFSASSTNITIGDAVTFTDLSTNTPTSWSWTFEGGTPSTSTDQNPVVTYNTEGTFDVSLTVTNAEGSDTKTITNYINASTFSCSYCSIYYSNTSDDYISNVSFNTINNSSSSTNYTDYTSISTNISQGQTYTLSVNITVNGNWVQHSKAWIDWNGNCSFDDAGEEFDLGSTNGTTGTHTLSVDITVPANADLINTTMRIAENYSTDPTSCQSNTYGEGEDYSVNIIEGVVIDPPNCASLIAPADGATDISVVSILEWSTVANTDGYKLFFGTDNPPTNIANALDLGNQTTYTPSGGLNNNTTYYWEVIPYNTGGDASSCNTWSFTTIEGSTSGPVELSFTDFESGWGNWTDGGGDCRRKSTSYSPQGSYSADIQDNSGISSSFYSTNGFDVHTDNFVQIQVEFTFQAVSMDNSNEDFWVQYFDGSAWYTVADFDYSIHFDNNVVYIATVNIYESDVNFPTDMKLRFMCDASGNRDDIYVDEIRITASDQIMTSTDGLEVVANSNIMLPNAEELADQLRVYPNPANGISLNVASPFEMKTIDVYSMMGEKVASIKTDNSLNYSLDITNLKTGIYILRVEGMEEVEMIRFIKR